MNDRDPMNVAIKKCEFSLGVNDDPFSENNGLSFFFISQTLHLRGVGGGVGVKTKMLRVRVRQNDMDSYQHEMGRPPLSPKYTKIETTHKTSKQQNTPKKINLHEHSK
ncbi:hypothetical protein TNCV_171881 [Trichonephila clavipes]|nr:hypothetical protein TNCV_171881 [Trichonephila clavipes]